MEAAALRHPSAAMMWTRCVLLLRLQRQAVVVLWRCKRFQPVLVPEPSVDETYEVLLGGESGKGRV